MICIGSAAVSATSPGGPERATCREHLDTAETWQALDRSASGRPSPIATAGVALKRRRCRESPCRTTVDRSLSLHSCLGGWCQMGVWCAGVGGGGAGVGAVSGRVLWCGGVCWGLSGRCWAGVGRSGAQPRAHRCGVERSPSTPRRAMLAAAASRLKSASTLARPRTRAWRPPCFRRTRCASLRSTLGRTAR